MKEWVKRFYAKWGFYPICGGCGGGDDDNGQEAAYDKAVAPARQYQADMSALFKQVYEPYVRDIYGLWSELGKPIQRGQLETYRDVGLPAYRTLGEKFSADVATPWDESEMKGVFDKIWQQTREKTAAEWAPIEQRTSQRLAGAGALETGAALKAGTDIELGKYKSLETQAIDMALQEYNVKTQAKQQSYSNMFSYLNKQPGVDTSAISGVGTSSAGALTNVIPPYIQEEKQGNWLTGSKSGWEKTMSDLMFAPDADTAAQMATIGFMIGMSSMRYKKNIRTWARR